MSLKVLRLAFFCRSYPASVNSTRSNLTVCLQVRIHYSWAIWGFCYLRSGFSAFNWDDSEFNAGFARCLMSELSPLCASVRELCCRITLILNQNLPTRPLIHTGIQPVCYLNKIRS